METSDSRSRDIPTASSTGKGQAEVPAWVATLAVVGAIAITVLMILAIVSEADAQELDLKGLEQLGACESGNNYTIDTNNGFTGRVQWTQGTWNWIMAELGYDQWHNVQANFAPPSIQDEAALYLANGPATYPSPEGYGPEQFGLQHWPTCRYAITSTPVDCSINPQDNPTRCIEMGPDSLTNREPAPLQPVFTG